MKVVGQRIEPGIRPKASGAAVAEVARFGESLNRLGASAFIPKGVYRFKTHQAANRHWEKCLAAAMVRKANTAK